MSGVGLSFWKPDGTLVYYNPMCAFMVASFYSESLTGSQEFPEIQGREAFVVSRGSATGKHGTRSWGGIAQEEEHIKIVGNKLVWNIPNQRPQQIGGLYAPFPSVKLRFFIIVR